MTNWTDPFQPSDSSQSYQPPDGQLPPPPPPQIPFGQPSLAQQSLTGQLPPSPPQTPFGQQPHQSPTTNPLTPHQSPTTNPLTPHQSPTTNPLTPYQPPAGQLPPYQPPAGQLPPYQPPRVQQSPALDLTLRMRYSPEQIRLYFFPYPDRGPTIRALKQKIRALYQQMIGLAVGALILAILFIATATQGVSYLGILALAGIIGIIVLITQRMKKLRPLRDNLRGEVAAETREKEYTRSVRPPNERQYDKWIDEISEELYMKAPGRLRLSPHPEYVQWEQSNNTNSSLLPSEKPEKFGASLSLEGRPHPSDVEDDKFPQISRWTHYGSPRPKHYSIYMFTSLFITATYVGIYTATVNLCEATRDREKLEYGYHQHLSHMLLDIDTSLQSVDTQPPTQIAFKESTLSMDFDSGTRIRRNISTLHIGHEPVSDIDYIHDKLIKALIEHEWSMAKSMKEANNSY